MRLVAVCGTVALVSLMTGCDKTSDVDVLSAELMKLSEVDGVSVEGGDTDAEEHIDMMSCLTTNDGTRMKVLIKRQGVVPSFERGGPPAGNPLRYFYPYFVFAQEQQWLLIGPSPVRRDLVWVHERECQPWNTRIGARYVRVKDKPAPPLYIYASEQDASRAIKGEKVDPIAKTLYAYDQETLMPWPIVSKMVLTIGTTNHDVYQLAFLGSSSPSSGSSAPAQNQVQEAARQEIVQRVMSGINKLDVVFVIDTTESMQPCIEQTRNAVRNVSAMLRELPSRPDVAFGLVEYRDYVEKIYFDRSRRTVCRAYPLTSNYQQFLSRIGDIHEATDTSEDQPEAGGDGMMMALNEMEWRAEGLSERIVILIGDNSFHLPGHRSNPQNISIPGIIEHAKRPQLHVRIFSLLARHDAEDSRDEDVLRRRQFRELAEGTGGSMMDLEQAERIVGFVEDIIRQGAGVVEERIEVVREITAGAVDLNQLKVQQQSFQQSVVDSRRLVEVVQFLQMANIDPRSIMPDGTAFATGWVVPQQGDTAVVRREAYLSKPEMSNLITLISEISGRLSHSPSAIEDLIDTSYGFVSEGRKLKVVDEVFTNQGMKISWLARTAGLPIHEHSILNRSWSDLLTATNEERAVIAQRLQRHLVPLVEQQANTSCFPSADPLSFGWILENSIP